MKKKKLYIQTLDATGNLSEIEEFTDEKMLKTMDTKIILKKNPKDKSKYIVMTIYLCSTLADNDETMKYFGEGLDARMRFLRGEQWVIECIYIMAEVLDCDPAAIATGIYKRYKALGGDYLNTIDMRTRLNEQD